ncbi:histone-fold-containing protein [Plectosphaerella cucumerina]|uniref:Histone-fold-containing protein n=1 Tax=Plectosphaerella cucumerina TaxID=40658 RepID=A0A8K0T7U8_9PEZI|nr:histone-fold-containing protein [Plectosphaerella cucumerina]
MPYNTTAIPPRKEVTGQSVLPVARVKKILAQDQDINTCSANAAFIISMATELFVQHLANEAQNAAKMDRKPRRNIQYKDMANAVAHNDHLEFLEDLIPRTTPFKKVKASAAATRAQMSTDQAQDGKKQTKINAAAAAAAAAASSAVAGSSSKKRASSSAALNGINGHDTSSDDPNAQLQLEMRQAAATRDTDGDVNMAG